MVKLTLRRAFPFCWQARPRQSRIQRAQARAQEQHNPKRAYEPGCPVGHHLGRIEAATSLDSTHSRKRPASRSGRRDRLSPAAALAIATHLRYSGGMHTPKPDPASWTAREDQVVEIVSPQVAAEKLGRTLEAVLTRRHTLQLAGFVSRKRRKPTEGGRRSSVNEKGVKAPNRRLQGKGNKARQKGAS